MLPYHAGYRGAAEVSANARRASWRAPAEALPKAGTAVSEINQAQPRNSRERNKPCSCQHAPSLAAPHARQPRGSGVCDWFPSKGTAQDTEKPHPILLRQLSSAPRTVFFLTNACTSSPGRKPGYSHRRQGRSAPGLHASRPRKRKSLVPFFAGTALFPSDQDGLEPRPLLEKRCGAVYGRFGRRG
jgi:hypothetical protein